MGSSVVIERAREAESRGAFVGIVRGADSIAREPTEGQEGTKSAPRNGALTN